MAWAVPEHAPVRFGGMLRDRGRPGAADRPGAPSAATEPRLTCVWRLEGVRAAADHRAPLTTLVLDLHVDRRGLALNLTCHDESEGLRVRG
jgi:hypothetical protein